MRAEAEADQATFDRLQDELKAATAVSDKMTRLHSERDAELEHYRQLAGSLLERWQAVFAQMDLRQRELSLLGRHMNSYKQSYEWLIHWLREARLRQEQIEAAPVGNNKALKEQLTQKKVLREPVVTKIVHRTVYINILIYRNCWRRLRKTRTRLKIARKMQKLTLIL